MSVTHKDEITPKPLLANSNVTSSGPIIAQFSEYQTSNQLSVNATKAVYTLTNRNVHSRVECSNQLASASC